METATKLAAGATLPPMSVAAVAGGYIRLGGGGRWQLIVIYRGKHCPLCRKYLKGLDGLLDAFRAEDTEVVALSGDTLEKAASETSEEGWRFPVGYGLSVEQMRALGLYVSEPRSPQETDRPFPEPGLFLVNPDGRVHVVDISNAPFARPDLQSILNGVKFIRERNYPIRGTASRRDAP